MLIEILKYLGMFVVFFIVAYLIYYFLVTHGQIRSLRGKTKKKKELSTELGILKKHYDINIEKIGTIKVLRIVNFINALLVTILVMAVLPVKQMWLKLVIIIVLLAPTIWAAYYFLAKYLKHLERKNDNV